MPLFLGADSSDAPCALWYASPESVLELTGDLLHVAHATGTGGLSSLGLLAPVVCVNVR